MFVILVFDNRRLVRLAISAATEKAANQIFGLVRDAMASEYTVEMMRAPESGPASVVNAMIRSGLTPGAADAPNGAPLT